MEGTPQIVQTLDCLGLLCPMPIVKLSQALKRVAVGDVLELIGTDPGLVPDMDAYQRQTGHEVFGARQDGKVYRFLVRRTK